MIFYERRRDPAKGTIYIISGSNGLFGTNSDILRQRTHLNVENYALQGNIHMDLLFSQITGKAKSGDIILAPLEFEIIDAKFGNQYGYINYFQSLHAFMDLDVVTAYRLYTSVPLRRFWDGLVWYIYGPARSKALLDDYSENALLQGWERRTGNESYSHLALTNAGDINIPRSMTNPSTPETVVNIPARVAKEGPVQLAKWQTYFDQRGIRLVVIPPVLLHGAGKQFFTVDGWQRVENFRAHLERGGAPMHCDPIDAVYSSIYRLDTIYHTNAEGARLRTEALADCVIRIIAGERMLTDPIDVHLAIARARSRMDAQSENFGIGDMPFQIRLRDIARVREALLAYKSETGYFPTSDGSDIAEIAKRLNTATPKYANGLYKSNGKDFKLIVTGSAEDCAVVADNWPEMIDPKRIADSAQCGGYGYWTTTYRTE